MTEANVTSRQKVSLVWRIPNFKKIRESISEINYQTTQFSVVSNPTGQSPTLVKWNCYLSQKNDQPEKERNMGLYFSLSDPPQDLSELHAAIRVQVHNIYPDQSFYKSFSFYKDMKSTVGHGFSKFIKQEDEVPLTKDDTLEIYITVHIANSKLEALTALHESNFLQQLGFQLSYLRDEPLDICSKMTKIVSKDGKEFPVDRVVLAARSSVFCGMFQSKMSEEENGVVEIKDIDSGPLAVLLDFCHTGVLSKNWKDEEVLDGVVYGAHKYMLDDLKNFLPKVLGLICTDNNCGKLMRLAKDFGMKAAEEQLLEYFKANLTSNVEQVISFAEDAAKICLHDENPDSN